MTDRASLFAARDLLAWNDVLPNLRIVEEDHGATPTFMIVADYGWAERILCGGCYEQDAETILAALNEAVTRSISQIADPYGRLTYFAREYDKVADELWELPSWAWLRRRRLLKWRDHYATRVADELAASLNAMMERL